MDAQQIE
jgi:dynein heavy chain